MIRHPEEYLIKFVKTFPKHKQFFDSDIWDILIKCIYEAQDDSYNEALNDALENARCIDIIHPWNESVSVISESILKLKR